MVLMPVSTSIKVLISAAKMSFHGFGLGHADCASSLRFFRAVVWENERAVCMNNLDSPFFILTISLVAQCVAVYAGHLLRKTRPLSADERDDFDIIRNATLTLLALIIGFSFSMAVSRYDQRKNYEEAEANAIGTVCACGFVADRRRDERA